MLSTDACYGGSEAKKQVFRHFKLNVEMLKPYIFKNIYYIYSFTITLILKRDFRKDNISHVLLK